MTRAGGSASPLGGASSIRRIQMSKTTSIPIRLAGAAWGGDMQPLHALKEPVRYPEQCVYCGAPKSMQVAFNVKRAIRRAGEEKPTTYHYKVIAPYCDKHGKQSKRFGYLLWGTYIIAGLMIGLPLGVAIMIQTAPLFEAITGQHWTGYLGALIVGGLPVLIVGLLAVKVLKFILGLFLPTLKDYNMDCALGLTVVVAEPRKEAELPSYTLDFTFANIEFAGAFESLNRLSWEEIAAARDRLPSTTPAQARVIDAAKRAEARLDEKIEAHIQTLRDKKLGKREAAIALGEIGDARAVEPLIEALEDKQILVQVEAAKALGKIGDTRAVEPLIKIMAVEALGQIGDPRAVEPLIGYIESMQALPIATVLPIRALGEIGDPRAIDTLAKALKHKNRKVRTAAADALGEIGDARVLEPLTQAS